jgi:hypothetical protein
MIVALIPVTMNASPRKKNHVIIRIKKLKVRRWTVTNTRATLTLVQKSFLSTLTNTVLRRTRAAIQESAQRWATITFARKLSAFLAQKTMKKTTHARNHSGRKANLCDLKAARTHTSTMSNRDLRLHAQAPLMTSAKLHHTLWLDFQYKLARIASRFRINASSLMMIKLNSRMIKTV